MPAKPVLPRSPEHTHNPKVAGSNPAPATEKAPEIRGFSFARDKRSRTGYQTGTKIWISIAARELGFEPVRPRSWDADCGRERGRCAFCRRACSAGRRGFGSGAGSALWVRFQAREGSGPLVVGQVPPAGRHAGQAQGRPGLDRPRAPGGWLLHKAAGRRLAARHARGSPARVGGPPGRRRQRIVGPASVWICGYNSVRRDVRRRCRRISALLGAGPWLQAIDGPELPQRDQRPSPPGVRGDGAGGHHGPGNRAVARWDVQRSSAARALEQN